MRHLVHDTLLGDARLRRGLAVLTAAGALALPALAHAAHVTTLHRGETLTVTGQTGTPRGHVRRAVGAVVVEGRWNGGHAAVITRTHTDTGGPYRFVIRPHRRGMLVLRILTPDKRPQRFVVRVL
jgi:hypothetical protein